MNQVEEFSVRKAYQMSKQVSFETLAQFSQWFQKTYQSYRNSSSLTKGVDMDKEEQAMDFFHGLDQGRYGVFKTSMLNGWAVGAFNPPDTINKIWQTAGSWVKLVTRGEGGKAASYVAIEQEAKQSKKKQERQQKMKQDEVTKTQKKESSSEEEKKTNKDRSTSVGAVVSLAIWQTQCYVWTRRKHHRMRIYWMQHGMIIKQACIQPWGSIKCQNSWWTVPEFMVNNAVNITQVLLPTEVLLNNQADISIVHPMLLKNIEKSDRRIKVKGIGGLQLVVDQVGELEGFFQCTQVKIPKQMYSVLQMQRITLRLGIQETW
jgi:hypothetical protein